MKNPIFIVGLPRSGSTLLLNVMGRHPMIFRIGEMHFLNPWRKDFRYFMRHSVGDLSIDNNIRKMIDLIFSAEPVPGITGIFWRQDIKNVDTPDLRKSLFDRLVNSDRSLGSIFKAIIEAVTEFSGYNRCCAKFPVYTNHIPDLLEWYPQCRIIHITRDPRAIALSRTNDPGGTRKKVEKYRHLSWVIKKQMVAFVILQYVWTARMHVSFKNSKNYILLNYESLLSDPERTIKRLSEFLELDYTQEMLFSKNGEYAQHSSITGKQIKEFDPEAAYRWKNVIGSFDEKMVKLFARSGMKRLGYAIC